MADEDREPITQQQPDPQPYDGPIDSIADFCKLLKQELQIVGLRKLIQSGNVNDLAESKKLVGKYLMSRELQDMIDSQLERLRRAANAADEDEPAEPMLGADEDDDD